MFGLKKKEKNAQKPSFVVVSPVQGQLIDLTEVKDEVFSKKMMGEGFAIVPENGQIVSPVSGELVSLFPTGHAFGIHTENGVDVLVHIGLDTVNLNGQGFKVLCTQGQSVQAGQPVVQVEREAILEQGIDLTTMVVFTEGFKRQIHVSSRPVEEGAVLIQ